VWVWDNEGRLLHKVATDHREWINTISIQGSNFVIGADHWYEYMLTEQGCRYFRHGDSDGLIWATYTFDKYIKYWRQGVPEQYRPFLPKLQTDQALLLSETIDRPKESWLAGSNDKKAARQEIIIRDLRNNEKEIRRITLDPPANINFMWCNQEKLFIITSARFDKGCKYEILVMDFAGNIPDYQRNNSYEIVECFNLAQNPIR
jgi:hypothetical protein